MTRPSRLIWMIPTLLILAVTAKTPCEESNVRLPSKDTSASPSGSVLVERIERLRGLQEGRPSGDSEPQSLFDCELDDEMSVAMEIDRLRSRLSEATKSKSGRRDAARADPRMAAERQLRLELDRERLSFLLLAPTKRDSLLEHDARRRRAASLARSEDEVERRHIELLRQKALDEAKRARSETD